MKKFLVLGAFALLSACGSKPDATAPAGGASDAAMGAASAPAMGSASDAAMGGASDAAMGAASAGAMGAAAGPKAGVYDYTSPDGKKGTTAIMADGKFVDRDAAGKVIDKGTVAMKDGKTCFTTEKGETNCMTDSAPGPDGSFDSTAADGKVTKVMPHKKK